METNALTGTINLVLDKMHHLKKTEWPSVKRHHMMPG